MLHGGGLLMLQVLQCIVLSSTTGVSCWHATLMLAPFIQMDQFSTQVTTLMLSAFVNATMYRIICSIVVFFIFLIDLLISFVYKMSKNLEEMLIAND